MLTIKVVTCSFEKKGKKKLKWLHARLIIFCLFGDVQNKICSIMICQLASRYNQLLKGKCMDWRK